MFKKLILTERFLSDLAQIWHAHDFVDLVGIGCSKRFWDFFLFHDMFMLWINVIYPLNSEKWTINNKVFLSFSPILAYKIFHLAGTWCRNQFWEFLSSEVFMALWTCKKCCVSSELSNIPSLQQSYFLSTSSACKYVRFVGFDTVHGFKCFDLFSTFGLWKNSKNLSVHTKIVMFTEGIT